MPWVRLDDRFTSHRKVRLLSHQAFRLYVSSLCYAAENLTDGIIPASDLRIVADIKSSKAAANELLSRGLWHALDNGDFEIHDYHEYQPTAEQVKAERTAKSARQQRWREGKRAAKKQDTAPDVDASTPPSTDASRDAVETLPPNPSPFPPSPTEMEEQASRDGSLPRIGDRPRIPANARPLVDGITAAGIVVGWDLKPAEWFLIEALIQRCTIPVLVQHALAAAQGARSRIRSGGYFLPGWRSLPDVPTTFTAPTALPAAVGTTFTAGPKSRQQAETDDLFDRAMARARNRMTQEGS